MLTFPKCVSGSKDCSAVCDHWKNEGKCDKLTGHWHNGCPPNFRPDFVKEDTRNDDDYDDDDDDDDDDDVDDIQCNMLEYILTFTRGVHVSMYNFIQFNSK